MPSWCAVVVGLVSSSVGWWIAMAIVIMRGEVNPRFIEGGDVDRKKWSGILGKNLNLSLLGGGLLGAIWFGVYSQREGSPAFWGVMWTVVLPSFGWALLFSVVSFRRFLARENGAGGE